MDCARCPGRGWACGDCVVSVVLDPRPAMDHDVAAAVSLLWESGLIGPVHLALVTAPDDAARCSTEPGERRAG